MPFAEGSRIPWNEPGFSARMLREHLNQNHDRASRRFEVIERQVAWIHHTLLGGEAGRVLDLGCGPGLYTSRLAELGHPCTGIDFSPASIDYAKEEAKNRGLACDYRLADLREAELGEGYQAILWWFGEFNTFSPTEAEALLSRAGAALRPNGRIALELHGPDYVQTLGEAPPQWTVHEAGLFADEPHLTLRECDWHQSECVATERYFVFHQDRACDVYAQTTQAHSDEALEALFLRAGLEEVSRYSTLTGDDLEEDDPDLFGLVLQRRD